MELSERDERERLITRLNNNYGKMDQFPEIYKLSDQELNKVVWLFKKESAKKGQNPWGYTHFNEVIVMEKCVWEVIKDNPIHDEVKDKLKDLFEKELRGKLMKDVLSYGEPTGERYQSPYSNKPEESIILAKMCEDQIKRYTSNPNRKLSEEDIAKISKDMNIYNQILDDLKKVGISIPEDNPVERQLPTVEEIIQKIKTENPDVIIIMGNGAYEREGEYRLLVTLYNGVGTSIPIDKDTYVVLKEYFNNNPDDLSTHISKPKQEVDPIVQEMPAFKEEDPAIKEKYITDIISRMLDAGEFHNSGIDIVRKMEDIEGVRQHLRTKTMDELNIIYDTYEAPASGFGGK